MTPEQYHQKKIDLEVEFDRRKRELAKEFALSNNPFKVGDLFTDHIGTIRIKKIGTHIGLGLPACFYKGDNLNKDMSISKKEPERTAFQSNLKTKQP